MFYVNFEYINHIGNNSDKHVLSGIEFAVSVNEIAVILGSNGAGKSTLINSFFRRDEFVRGKAAFEGKNILELSENEINEIRKSEIRYVFQDPIKSFDQLKKINYYFKNISDKGRVKKLFSQFNLDNFDEIMNKRPYELSNGIAQRIAIISALSVSPKLVILDEPTSALDTFSANIIKNELLGLKSETSFLIVTQDLAFAKNTADRIAVLSDGALSKFYDVKDFFQEDIIHEGKGLIESAISLNLI